MAPEETKEIEMPIFNVTATMKTTLVVIAEDENHVWEVARENARRVFDDADEAPQIHVTGEVKRAEHLRDGWDGDCVPYGGDGNTRLRDLLTPNALAQADAACGVSPGAMGSAADDRIGTRT